MTLAASPLGENVFTGWTGACSGSGATCTLTVGGSGFVAATANFTAQQPGVRVITVEGRGSGSGTVTSTPGAILGNIVNGVAITDGPSVLALRPGQELELADVRDPAGAGGAARSRILLRGAISSGALLQADVPGSATASQYSASAQQVAARASGDYAQRADVSACQLTAR